MVVMKKALAPAARLYKDFHAKIMEQRHKELKEKQV